MKKNALPQALLTLVLCLASLVTTVAFARLMGYDCGTAAGLMAGAFTESTVIGTAGNAIARLDLPEAERQRLLNNIPVAYAVSYLVGTGFVTWFLSSLAPRLLRVDLRAESRKLEAESARGPSPDTTTSPAYREWDVRAYRLPDSFAARTVLDLERSFSPERVFVQRIRRGPSSRSHPRRRLRAGDLVVLSRGGTCSWPGTAPGPEVEDRELLDFPLATLDVVLTRKHAADRTLDVIAEEHGRGVVLQTLVRGGEQIPFGAGTVLNRGDLLRITGARWTSSAPARPSGTWSGPRARPTSCSSASASSLGGFLGALSVQIGDLPLSLTASGGALIMGLIFGWLRAVGRPSDASRSRPSGCSTRWAWPCSSERSGSARARASWPGCARPGPAWPWSASRGPDPHVAAVLFGRYVLKMNPLILLGACAGAGTATAALRAIQDEAGSKVPVLGYTVPYAIGNILLTAWGPVVVMLTR